MRLTTYLQSVPVTRGSLLAVVVLSLTVALGSTAALTLSLYLAPATAPAISGLWVLAYLIAAGALMLEQGMNWLTWLIRYRLLLVALLLGACLSIVWSIAPWVSAERIVHLLGTSLIGIYIGFSLPLMSILRVLGAALAVLLAGSAVAALMIPELGLIDYQGSPAWSGLTSSKNTLGFWSAVGVLLYATLAGSLQAGVGRLWYLALAGFSVCVLIMSESATSMLALLMGGSLALYIYIASRFQLGFLRMIVLALFFVVLAAAGTSVIDTASIVGRSDDLTGRLEVWRQTWALIMERPVTGYGYGTIWFPTDETLYIQQALTDFTWVVYHAHNGFLQLASEMGLPLSCVALLMVAQQLIEIVYCQYQRQQAGVLFVLAFVVAYLVGNFSESRFLINRELYWVLFIALPISMLRQVNVTLFDPVDDLEHAPDTDGSRGLAPQAGNNTPLLAWRGSEPAGATFQRNALSPIDEDGDDVAWPNSAEAGVVRPRTDTSALDPSVSWPDERAPDSQSRHDSIIEDDGEIHMAGSGKAQAGVQEAADDTQRIDPPTSELTDAPDGTSAALPMLASNEEFDDTAELDVTAELSPYPSPLDDPLDEESPDWLLTLSDDLRVCVDQQRDAIARPDAWQHEREMNA